MGLIIERWLDDTDERITKDDIVEAALEALNKIEELEQYILSISTNQNIGEVHGISNNKDCSTRAGR